MMARPIFGRLERFEQVRRLGVNERRKRYERPALGGDAPDAPVADIAARIAEINLAMLDNRIIPIGDVDGSVRAHFHIHRPKCGMIAADEIGLQRGGIERSFWSEREPANAMAAKIVGEETAAPLLRQ